MRRPKGIKTKKSVAKRLKSPAPEKSCVHTRAAATWPRPKNAKRLRRLGKSAVVDKTDVYRITQNLPFSH
jgi:large subunit ribosomal protein L35